MPAVTIYHNPRCSKSRQTLQLLRDRGIQPTIVEYLQTPPDEATLRQLLKALGLAPLDLIRQGELTFKELNLAAKKDDPDALIAAMVRYPVLIERPIVVVGVKARLGRPPEQVLEILPD